VGAHEELMHLAWGAMGSGGRMLGERRLIGGGGCGRVNGGWWDIEPKFCNIQTIERIFIMRILLLS